MENDWLEEAPPGWRELIKPLLAQCEKEGVKVVQVKEKFGGLRFYTQGKMSAELGAMIDDAENRSNTMCDQCGLPGKHVSPRGWIRTLCKEHENHTYN